MAFLILWTGLSIVALLIWLISRQLRQKGQWILVGVLVATQAVFAFTSAQYDLTTTDGFLVQYVVWAYGRFLMQGLLLAILLPRWVEGMSFSQLGWRSRNVLPGLLPAAGIGVLWTLLRLPLWPSIHLREVKEVEVVIGMILGRSVVHGITEEAFFRGYLWRKLSTLTGTEGWQVNLYQSLMCGFIGPISPHPPHHPLALLQRGCSEWVKALLVGWLRLRWDSVLPGVAANIVLYFTYGVIATFLMPPAPPPLGRSLI